MIPSISSYFASLSSLAHAESGNAKPLSPGSGGGLGKMSSMCKNLLEKFSTFNLKVLSTGIQLFTKQSGSAGHTLFSTGAEMAAAKPGVIEDAHKNLVIRDIFSAVQAKITGEEDKVREILQKMRQRLGTPAPHLWSEQQKNEALTMEFKFEEDGRNKALGLLDSAANPADPHHHPHDPFHDINPSMTPPPDMPSMLKKEAMPHNSLMEFNLTQPFNDLNPYVRPSSDAHLKGPFSDLNPYVTEHGEGLKGNHEPIPKPRLPEAPGE